MADGLGQSWLEVSRRPGRAVVTGLGVALGGAAVVATVTLVTTIRFQVSDEFDALLATQIELRAGVTTEIVVSDASGAEYPWFPPPRSALERTAALDGVEGLAVVRETFSDEQVTLNRVADPMATPMLVPVRALNVEGFDALGIRLGGPGWNHWHQDRAERVVAVGRQTADDLGLGEFAAGDQIFVIVEEAPRLPALRRGLIMPLTRASLFAMDTNRDRVIVVVAPGAAGAVARVVSIALDPAGPERWTAYAPADDEQLRQAVDSQLEVLSLGLGSVVLLLGVVSIGNATLSSVLQRLHEIGLRRALGARPRHIAAHILLDATVIGAIGGVIGAMLGLTATLAVTAHQGWQPVIDPRIPAATVGIGVLAGILAGAYPARVGSRLQPTEALRRD